jgi:hypothetical protein
MLWGASSQSVNLRTKQEDGTMESDIRHCANMLCRERALARSAPSAEIAELHLQLIMLYKAQFKLLRRRMRLRLERRQVQVR